MTLGSPAAGRCAGVTGLLFRAPHSGPGNAHGAGALNGIVCTRATSHPECPDLVCITPQPDSSTPSASHAQPRLLDSSQPSIPETPPNRPPSPAIRPPHPGPCYPQLDPRPGLHIPYITRLRTRAPSIPSRGPACPHARWGWRDPPCCTFPCAAVTNAPPGSALQARRQCSFPRLVLASSPPPQFPQTASFGSSKASTNPSPSVAASGSRVEVCNTPMVGAVWAALLLDAELASSRKPAWLTRVRALSPQGAVPAVCTP